MEELTQDTLYFFHRTNLTHLIDDTVRRVTIPLSPPHTLQVSLNSGLNHEQEFWSNVSAALVEDLGGEEAYLTDLHMFGYSVNQYLNHLGLDQLAASF